MITKEGREVRDDYRIKTQQKIMDAVQKHSVVMAGNVMPSGDSFDFFAVVDALERHGLIRVVNHPDSSFGQHQLLCKPITP